MVAKTLTAELFQVVQESPLGRVSASLDDPLKMEAPMLSLLKLLSVCKHYG